MLLCFGSDCGKIDVILARPEGLVGIELCVCSIGCAGSKLTLVRARELVLPLQILTHGMPPGRCTPVGLYLTVSAFDCHILIPKRGSMLV